MLTKDKKRNVGELDKRVLFESFTTEQTGTGGTKQTWSALKTRWARIRPLSGSERRQVDSLQQEVSHVITVRHDADLLSGEIRAVHDSRTFNIHYGINADEADFYAELAATELIGE